MGTPENITIFNTQSPDTFRYFNIKKLSGRVLVAEFTYEEGGEKHLDKLLLQIPNGLDEIGVRDYIVQEINKTF